MANGSFAVSPYGPTSMFLGILPVFGTRSELDLEALGHVGTILDLPSNRLACSIPHGENQKYQ